MNDRKTQKQINQKKQEKYFDSDKFAELIDRVVKSIIGGLIGLALALLFGAVVLALVAKAFMSTDDLSYQLLNSAVTLVGTLLGAVLGYLLGRNNHASKE